MNVVRPSKRLSVRSFYRHPLVAATYDLIEGNFTDDIHFYRRQARKARGRILEIGCGTGRVLLPLAETGKRVTGIDNSAAMLSVLRRRLPSLPGRIRSRVELKKADMQGFRTPLRFSAAFIPCRTFSLNLTNDDQLAALRCIRRHLKPGGTLAMDLFDPSPDLLRQMHRSSGRKYELITERWIPEDHVYFRVLVKRNISLSRSLVRNTFEFEIADPDGKNPKKSRFSLTYRYVSRQEMERLFAGAGFRPVSLHSDFKGRRYRPGRDQVWVCKAG